MTQEQRNAEVGGEDVTAEEFAAHAISTTQGLYNKGNRPNWARSAVGSTVFTFRQYSIHYVEFIKRLWGDRLIPRKAAVIALGILVLMSGAGGLPGADDLDDLVDSFGHLLGYGTNSKRWKHEVLTETLGFSDAVADVALHGLAPANLGSRLGVANILPGTRALDPARTDKWQEVADVFGAPGSLIMNSLKAAQALAEGEVTKAAKLSMPSALANALKAGEMLATGEYRDNSGNKVVDADAGDAVLKAAGFNPVAASKRSQILAEEKPDTDVYNWKKRSFIHDYARATVDRDAGALSDVRAELRAWNEENPELAIKLNQAAIAGAVKQMKMDADQRSINSAPKALRAKLRQDLSQ